LIGDAWLFAGVEAVVFHCQKAEFGDMSLNFILVSYYWETIEPRLIMLAILGFFSILFLQSGLDKVMDRKGNLEWMVPHFAKSPFKDNVPMLLSILTIMEMASGILSALAAIGGVFMELRGYWLPFAAVTLCTFNLIMLFMGQRLAKDYGGAAGIVPYVIMGVGSMVYFGIF
jgi:putative oxidoreductase